MKTTPMLEPMAQLNIGAELQLVPPPDGEERAVTSRRAIR